MAYNWLLCKHLFFNSKNLYVMQTCNVVVSSNDFTPLTPSVFLGRIFPS